MKCDVEKCIEDAERDRKCIFHLENKSEKEIEIFNSKFNEKLRLAVNDKDGDFTGFIIPYIKGIVYKDFNKEMNFKNVIFEGEVNFSGIKFHGKMNFNHAVFKKKANFSKTIFYYKVNFSMVDFRGETNFTKAEFKNDAIFTNLTFDDFKKNYDANFEGTKFFSNVIFDNIEFSNGANFSFSIFKKEVDINGLACRDDHLILFQHVKFYEPKNVTFHNNRFENISFLYTDTSNIQFLNDKWIKIKNRLVIVDEIIIEHKNIKKYEKLIANYEKDYEFLQRSIIAQLYRRLRQNFENNYRFVEAGDFFIGEMEMVRLDANPRPRFKSEKVEKNKLWLLVRRNISFLGFYKFSSLYGESYIRPIILAVIIIISYPILIFWLFGVTIPDDIFTYLRKSEMNFFLIDRSYIGENLSGIIILSLLTIALKRKFERKK